MIAGRMRSVLVIQRPSVSVNGYGEEKTIWQETAAVHAERVKQTGRRNDEVSEHFPDHTAEFNIRDAHEVRENWRVRQKGGDLYTVVSILPNIERGYKTLICDKVNE